MSLVDVVIAYLYDRLTPSVIPEEKESNEMEEALFHRCILLA